MSALGTEFDKALLQNADFDLGSAQFEMPQMNYKDRKKFLQDGLLSALAVHDFDDNYNDAGYPASPTLLKKAGDKKVLKKMK